MSATLLERKEIAVPNNILNMLEQDVLQKAEARLSYNFAKQERERIKSEQLVAEIFNEAQLKPFSDESVIRYMKSKANKAFFSGLFTNICVVITLIAVAFGSGIASSNLPRTTFGFTLFMLAVLTGLAAIASVCVGIGEIINNRPRWYEVAISGFNGAIPTFALMTANNLSEIAHKHGRVAKFSVCYLADRDEVRNRRAEAERRADPFLVVRFAHNSGNWEYRDLHEDLDNFVSDPRKAFYIEVWDEPGFERKREV